MENKKVVLVIMDGWAHYLDEQVNAIKKADIPFIDGLYKSYPNAELITHGDAVGLPKGQMGNSEIGHLNIGAGRIIYHELLRIDKFVKSGKLDKKEVLLGAFEYAKKNNKPLHFIGLVSKGGIHSSMNHLMALCDIAKRNDLREVYIHAFTDGRDTDTKQSDKDIKELEDHLKNSAGQLVSVVGRYYAMDRDNRWERIKEAYDLLVHGKGKSTKDFHEAIMASYEAGVTDEFIQPIVKVDDEGVPIATIKEGDAVICFNFRTDRCRQITEVLTQKGHPEHDMHTVKLHYVTMTRYDKKFKNVKVLFEKENINMTLGEVLEKNDKKQIRVSETEKYPHVTYFFSGGREEPFDGEKRIMIPSPKVATYDLQPEMSAPEVKNAIVKEIRQQEVDFVCLNFANSDMVGHTGVFEAAVKAVETVDKCVKEVVENALDNNYTCIITSDHGNADYMINTDGSVNTAHTKNLVPCILVDKDRQLSIKDGKLGDLAPTILTLMDIDIPEEMTGNVLL